MILDSHCHVWARWPYAPPVPDPESRASPAQLLHEMDQAGVARAVLIAAAIGDNPDNNDFVAAAAAATPDRFVPFADIDSRWSATHRQPGAAERLDIAAARWRLAGFTHYLREDDDGAWLLSDEGRRFFGLAQTRRLIASLSVVPSQMAAVAALAEAFPKLRIHCHHMAFVGPRTAATADAARRVLDAARHPNIAIKISGFGNVAAPGMDYPYPDLVWFVRALHEFYGPWRLSWGSDYPVSRRHMTYRQTLDMLRRHCGLPEGSVETILGPSFAQALAAR
jgi:L-fuconolactonase